MKVTVEVDCTPEEARRFLGFPDLAPLHGAYVERMRTAIEQGVTPDMIGSVLKTWGPFGEAGMSIWKQMVEQIGSVGQRP